MNVRKCVIFLNKKTSIILMKDPLFVFIILLLLTILTRFAITYIKSVPDTVIAPETQFKLLFGNDFNLSVFVPAFRMLHENDRGELAYIASGHAFSLFTVPFVYLFEVKNYLSIYHWFVLLTILGYIMLIYLISKSLKNRKDKVIPIIFFLIFILGVPGSLGLMMGNVDILLSLLVGFILFFFINNNFNRRSSGKAVFYYLLLGFILAVLANEKIFLLPFSVIFILFSKRIFITLFSFIMSFYALIYAPNLFSYSSDFSSFVKAIVEWNNVTLNINTAGNHSFAATATIFSNCLSHQNCESTLGYGFISILVFVTFIGPFISQGYIFKLIKESMIKIKKSVKKKISVKKLSSDFKKSFLKRLCYLLNCIKIQRYNKGIFILLLVLCDAVINLLPKVIFNYRLYYSLPILLVFYLGAIKDEKTKTYLIFSAIFLSLKGLWVVKFNLEDSGLLDPRILNLFVILHFYFLIRAGLENLINNKMKTI